MWSVLLALPVGKFSSFWISIHDPISPDAESDHVLVSIIDCISLWVYLESKFAITHKFVNWYGKTSE